MKICGCLGLAIALAACSTERSDQKPEPEQAGPKSEITEEGGSLFFSIEADAVIGNTRPTLILVCEGGKAKDFQLRSVLEPSKPTPLAGTYGHFQFDGADPVKVEMAWNLSDLWGARDNGGAQDGRKIAVRVFKSKQFTYAPPSGYGLKEISWRTPIIPPKVVSACA
ncbi:hypothetical protein [Sphingobium sp. WCS2017Hpa-17]|uniref:hypothetical protein n=1 Tax=Sphingobium sp. WCS2017Hpa-17 TaxID=3073638 RepID=UPI00288A2B85|nr:hypothetical protein [Sphingobium sp. WCS2017Hpa-17]